MTNREKTDRSNSAWEACWMLALLALAFLLPAGTQPTITPLVVFFLACAAITSGASLFFLVRSAWFALSRSR